MNETRAAGTTDEAAPGGLRIFLNYRRDDTADAAGRLYDALSARFGEDHVFIDIDTIEPGVDFEEVVNEAVESADVIIAMIGRQWLTTTDSKGRRRVDNPDDFVRLELEAALRRNVRVLPVLVQGVDMPSGDELPEGLRKLARRNALEMSHARWNFDLARLTRALEKVEQEKLRRTAAERERAEGERAEGERAEREQAEREQAEREQADREQADREAAESQAQLDAAKERKARRLEQEGRGAAARESLIKQADRKPAEQEAGLKEEVERGEKASRSSQSYIATALGRRVRPALVIASAGLLLVVIGLFLDWGYWTNPVEGEGVSESATHLGEKRGFDWLGPLALLVMVPAAASVGALAMRANSRRIGWVVTALGVVGATVTIIGMTILTPLSFYDFPVFRFGTGWWLTLVGAILIVLAGVTRLMSSPGSAVVARA